MQYPNITLTITTFKRTKLLFRTLHSFFNTCLDLDLIERYLMIDDGTSEEDLKKIKNTFPCFEIHKNPNKGQASSINRIIDMTQTDWFFHIEDDWLFLKRDNYIRKLFDIAHTNLYINNITLRSWKGDVVSHNRGEYILHRFDFPNPDINEDSNWFGLTFNPSLNYLPIMKRLGRYNEKHPIHNREWDKLQAYRYWKWGFRRASIIGNYIKHIGENNSAYKFRGSSF